MLATEGVNASPFSSQSVTVLVTLHIYSVPQNLNMGEQYLAGEGFLNDFLFKIMFPLTDTECLFPLTHWTMFVSYLFMVPGIEEILPQLEHHLVHSIMLWKDHSNIIVKIHLNVSVYSLHGTTFFKLLHSTLLMKKCLRYFQLIFPMSF